MKVSSYIVGSDIVGEVVIPKVQTYTDDATVRQVQAALLARGYDPGKVDGVMGPKTAAAIRRMQIDADLIPTGEIDYGVIMALKGTIRLPSGSSSSSLSLSTSPMLSPATTRPQTTSLDLLHRPVWQLALGGVGVASIAIGLIALMVRR